MGKKMYNIWSASTHTIAKYLRGLKRDLGKRIVKPASLDGEEFTICLDDVKTWHSGDDRWEVVREKLSQIDPASKISLQIPVRANIYPTVTGEPIIHIAERNTSLELLVNDFERFAQENGAKYTGAISEDEENVRLTLCVSACEVLNVLYKIDVKFADHGNHGHIYVVFEDMSAASIQLGAEELEEDELSGMNCSKEYVGIWHLL